MLQPVDLDPWMKIRLFIFSLNQIGFKIRTHDMSCLIFTELHLIQLNLNLFKTPLIQMQSETYEDSFFIS